MNDKPAIQINHVSKNFILPHEKHTTIKSLFVNIFKRKKYEKQKALRSISFDIKKGEFFGIVGRNGCGKSTLLKIIAGIYNPTNGFVKVNGSLTPFIELGVGFSPELTGRENVFLNGALLGFNRKEMRAMYKDIVEFAELQNFMDQKLKNYSSGMQVRLAFSIAIRAKSDILLLDEVLAVGDAAFQQKCFDYFSNLKAEGKTVVLVSHDAGVLNRYCDRGVLIEKGVVSKSGNIKDVIQKYQNELAKEEAKRAYKEQNITSEKVKKQVEISNIFTSNKSERTTGFDFGEDITISLKLKHNTDIKTLNVGIGVYNGIYGEDADRVFGVQTQEDRTTIDPKSKSIQLTIKKPELKNGKYVVYAIIFGESENIPYDTSYAKVKFTVKNAPNISSRGVIMAEHSWSKK